MRHGILDFFQIATDAVVAFPETIPPPEEIAACARWFNAEFPQLFGFEGEERFPSGDFGGVGGQVAADEGEEGFRVGDEGGGSGDLLGGGDLATAAEGGGDWAEKKNGESCGL